MQSVNSMFINNFLNHFPELFFYFLFYTKKKSNSISQQQNMLQKELA